MTTTRKKTTRGKAAPAQKLEAAVASVNRAINAAVRGIEREGTGLKPEQIVQAFAFIAHATAAGQQKALASVQAAGLSSFKLGMTLPNATLPVPAVVPAISQPTGPRGPSVDDIGGRFVAEVRNAARETTPPHEPGTGFITDDEEDNE